MGYFSLTSTLKGLEYKLGVQMYFGFSKSIQQKKNEKIEKKTKINNRVDFIQITFD